MAFTIFGQYYICGVAHILLCISTSWLLSLFKIWGQQHGSDGKGACSQSWQSEINPQDPPTWWKERTNSLRLFSGLCMYTMMQKDRQTEEEKRERPRQTDSEVNTIWKVRNLSQWYRTCLANGKPGLHFQHWKQKANKNYVECSYICLTWCHVWKDCPFHPVRQRASFHKSESTHPGLFWTGLSMTVAFFSLVSHPNGSW